MWFYSVFFCQSCINWAELSFITVTKANSALNSFSSEMYSRISNVLVQWINEMLAGKLDSVWLAHNFS